MRHFFNYIRTHQNLAGLTPAEAWEELIATDLAKTPPKSTQLVQGLYGLRWAITSEDNDTRSSKKHTVQLIGGFRLATHF